MNTTSFTLEFVLSIKFKLKPTILIFRTKLAQKGFFQSKRDEMNSAHSEKTILNFCNKSVQKGYFWSKTRKANITTGICIFQLVKVLNF